MCELIHRHSLHARAHTLDPARSNTAHGVQILGPSDSGDPEALRVRFPDGVIDDWPVEDFRDHDLDGNE
jgi:hypothetical protein